MPPFATVLCLPHEAFAGTENPYCTDFKTTALLQKQEMLAWQITRAWLGNYYRTYDQSVQAEVTGALANPNDFIEGPMPFDT